MSADHPTRPGDFIRSIIRSDLAANNYQGRVVTRFPPEPNGYLHIGHTKAIYLNYGIAEEFEGGVFHLRFDDTNPSAEEAMYVEAQERDLRWLGVDWGEHLYFASDYFEQLYQFALRLIERGKAFVCDLSSEEILERRGTLTTPGIESPYRTRSSEENLDLFQRMRAGEFEPGARTLRARIDMASPVLPMRDPILYRIVATPHHRTGDTWPIYPMYDFAHSLSDAIERITHSLCTLEFADRRPLYDWILEQLDTPLPRPQQIEFARLNLSHTVVSKRRLRKLVEDGHVAGWDDPRMPTISRLRKLVEDGHVAGWDDPRMPTISALRRRGYTPRAIRNFSEGVGVARRENVIQLARLEHSIREDLNRTAPRMMAVLRPLRVVIENYPEEQVEELPAVNNPEDPGMGTRDLPFSRVLYIERDDFLEDPPRKFFRLAPGREVRLRYAYFITCTGVVRDEQSGEIVELRCTYDPATRGGDAPDGRKVRGTLHWVSAAHALEAEVRLYDVLFTREDPDDVEEGEDLTACLNPRSLEVVSGCRVEPSLASASPGDRYQFERLGYFCVDPDSAAGALVFNRTVTLRDTWAKIAKKSKG
jgi:glutaminyl-tRNA synthetase